MNAICTDKCCLFVLLERRDRRKIKDSHSFPQHARSELVGCKNWPRRRRSPMLMMGDDATLSLPWSRAEEGAGQPNNTERVHDNQPLGHRWARRILLRLRGECVAHSRPRQTMCYLCEEDNLEGSRCSLSKLGERGNAPDFGNASLPRTELPRTAPDCPEPVRGCSGQFGVVRWIGAVRGGSVWFWIGVVRGGWGGFDLEMLWRALPFPHVLPLLQARGASPRLPLRAACGAGVRTRELLSAASSSTISSFLSAVRRTGREPQSEFSRFAEHAGQRFPMLLLCALAHVRVVVPRGTPRLWVLQPCLCQQVQCSAQPCFHLHVVGLCMSTDFPCSTLHDLQDCPWY